VIRQLTSHYEYQIKFVVDSERDLPEIRKWLESFPEIPPQRVQLMPQGVTVEELAGREPWLRNFCAENQFRFCQRMHIFWYGNRRGT
jgi:7-carboxy-7-deazaguanine synthase